MRIVKITLILVYCFLFGEVYFQIINFLEITKVHEIDTEKLAEKKVNMEIDEKADINVLIVGDSQLAGYGFRREEDRFSNLLQKNLNEKFSDKKINIIDTLLGGQNIFTKWWIFNKFLKNNPSRPDILILSYKLKDVYGTFPKERKDDFKSLKDIRKQKDKMIVAKEKKGFNIKKILHKSQLLAFAMPRINTILIQNGIILKGSQVYHILHSAYLPEYVGWQKTQQYLLDIKKTCDEEKIDFVIVVVPQFPLDPPDFRQRSTATFIYFCNENDIKVIDAYDWVKKYGPDELALSRFDGHPNVKGHKVIADRMSEVLEEIIILRKK